MGDALQAAQDALSAAVKAARKAMDSSAPAEKGYVVEALGLLERAGTKLEKAVRERNSRAVAKA